MKTERSFVQRYMVESGKVSPANRISDKLGLSILRTWIAMIAALDPNLVKKIYLVSKGRKRTGLRSWHV